MCLVMLRHSYYRAVFFTHTFQLSGYKLKEYRTWLMSNWNSHVLSGKYALANVLLLLFLVFIGKYFTITAPVVLISVFISFWFFDVGLYRRKQKKPLVVTHRVKRFLVPMLLIYPILPITGVVIGIQLGSIVPDVYIFTFGWLLADIFIPFFVMLSGFLMQPIENRIQVGYINKAQNKLKSMPELLIIGITGSYGKTSTKFALAKILSERFSVCFTPGSYNTPMGICKVINNDLQPNHQILILEMGARYEGNIRELCDIAHPNIAVLTNIGIAHLETFGSKEVIARTKGELIDALNPGDAAFVNGDDEIILNMISKRLDITKVTAGIRNGNFLARNIKYDETGCTFKAISPLGEEVEVNTRLLGKHNVQNILLGFAVGSHLGLRLQTMAIAASRIDPVEHRLEFKNAGKYFIIDDAFNSNPVGAANAVEVLSAFQGGRRIIITPGMVELGDAEYELNKQFGDIIGRSGIEQVVLVGPKRTKPILQGILETGYPESQVYIARTLFEANSWLKENVQSGDVVLYENDLPDTYEE
jgi:UDP-N-acetylmuramoyl-tripeptide--D-alanyl-D-alanine ligase